MIVLIKKKRFVVLFTTGIVLLGLLGFVVKFCMHNARVKQGWVIWTKHLSGPPNSWVSPSNDLYRFGVAQNGFLDENGLPIDQLYGYKNKDGLVVIEPIFSGCGERFYYGVASAYDPETKQSGFINPDGSWKVVVNGIAHNNFVGNMGEFQVIGIDGYPLYGFVNADGIVAVPPVYSDVKWYVDGYVLVSSRTWVGRVTRRLGDKFAVSLDYCLSEEIIILDQNGNPAKLPL